MKNSHSAQTRPGSDIQERIIASETQDAENLAAHVGRYRFALDLVAGKRVLDLACGTGYGTAILASAASSCRGVDIDSAAIEHARQANAHLSNVEHQCGTAESQIALGLGPFDICVSFETIEHVEDPAAFLSAFRHLLRPGGRLLISTPNRYLYSPRNKSGSETWNPYHRFEWDTSEFLDLLARHGFRVEQAYGQYLRSSSYAVFHRLRDRLAHSRFNNAVTQTIYSRLNPEKRNGDRPVPRAQLEEAARPVVLRPGMHPLITICSCAIA